MRRVLFALLLVVVSTSAMAQGAALLSHRAVYDLVLARAASGSGVIGARGRLVMEWGNACGGYTLHQRFRNELRQTGSDYAADLTVSTWEASDGSAFRFNSRHVVDDTPAEEVAGRADMGERSGAGEAKFRKPSGSTLALPRETIFPTQHTILLLARAAAGEKFIRAKVFDGSGVDGLQETTAIILERLPSGSYDGVGADILASLESWRIRVAYFKYDAAGGDSHPEYEVGFRLFANGVSTDVILDYGDFALKGALKVLDPVGENC